MAKKYDASSIDVHEGLEGVRKKPSMYIGELGDHGVFHMLCEVSENSIDEAQEGNDYVGLRVYGKTLQSFVVADKGRGIPVGLHKKTKQSALTTILTKLHAGGKFNADSYKSSRGTHGVGVSVTNALSAIFEVWSYRNKQWNYQRFQKGKPATKVIKAKFPAKEVKGLNVSRTKGTIIKYTPDFSILGKKAKVTDKVLEEWAVNTSNLNHGIKIQVVTEGIDEVFHNKEGPIHFLNKIIEDNGVEVIGKPFIFTSKTLTVALQWSDYEGDDGVLSYINGALSADGGTHMVGMNNAIGKSFKDFSSKKGLTNQNLRYGVVGFIHYKLSGDEAQYDSQTKEKLVTLSAKKDVNDQLLKPLAEYIKKNKSTATSIVKRALDLKAALEKAKELTAAATKLNKSKRQSLPGKLTSCSSKTPAQKRELFIVEGDSAGGTCKNARFKDFQGILTLRGKVTNGAKTTLAKLLSSKEVQNILISLGINAKDIIAKKRTEKFNYGKIMILSDADPDGKHINNLVCTDLFLLCPELYSKGMVYIVDAPLYVAKYKGRSYYGDNLKDIKKNMPRGGEKYIQRLKGWGEASWELLRDIAFDPKKRKLIKVLPIKGKDKLTFMKVVGEDTTKRKEILGLI